MIGALASLVLLSAAVEAPDWFKAIQYTPATASLRGCSECQGEPDDVCEVRAGALTRPIADYDQKRAGPDRVRLLRSKADPDCAVPTAAFHGPRTHVELAAIRVARTAPGAAVIEKLAGKFANAGWPRAPHRRKGQPLAPAALQRDALRAALVCWSAERSWPARELDASAFCEWWLLPFRADGEPDLAGAAFPLLPRRDRWPESFHFGDARWARAFDRAAAVEDAVLLGEPAAATAPPAPQPVALAPTAAAVVSRCGEEARTRSALLDRFDQWEARIVGARRSLDRGRWALDLAAWSGHCQELDVLRGVLEQQLGCSVAQEGRCIAAGGEAAR